MSRKKTFFNDSEIHLNFMKTERQTVLKDVYTTPPFRVMRPFQHPDGFCEVMVMNSGPGILEGDRQIEKYRLEAGTNVEISSQSYEKVFQMIRGDYATRDTTIQLGSDSCFIFRLLPMILYKNSHFKQTIRLDLEPTARAIISNILVFGRVGSGESFEFTQFETMMDVYQDNEYIYGENTFLKPAEQDLTSLGFYEGYDHCLNFSVFNFQTTDSQNQALYEIIQHHCQKRDLLGGLSTSYRGDLQIRILGKMGQDLMECSDELIDYLKSI